ncbi:hypothetical protein BDW59DRAFT_162593 [Aspergillus cavernicola]|uniref:BZIP domain-containing protein n=1 Tax=Aspergillus cavernicola TaxID=176166 RepID=A0ABR4I920_9EURO
MNLDWNPMASYTSTNSDLTDRSILWTSSSNFTLPQWPDMTQSPSPDHSGSDEPYPLPEDLLDFPDLRTSLADNPSPPTSTDGSAQDKSKRRREQNRNAQRAYRERKEKYIKNLLKHINEMNRNHIRLGDSYESLRRETLRLQDQVQDLKGQLEFWNKAQVVLVKFPEDAVTGTALNASSGLLTGSQNLQSTDPLLDSDVVYPTI